MTGKFFIALVLTVLAATAPRLMAQSPAGSATPPPGSKTQAPQAQKPAAPAPSSANPFPEDTDAVPVLPSGNAASRGNFEETGGGSAAGYAPLPSTDNDPVHSPDDPVPSAGAGQGGGWSSSLSEIDSALPPSALDTSQPEKRKNAQAVKEPTRQQAAAHNINVGSYYLDTKDWKGALSRFESALVLDPENPEVYWGLAEAEFHLGQFAKARTHFQLVLEYDPGSRHAREARKALKEPALAEAQSATPSRNPSSPPQ